MHWSTIVVILLIVLVLGLQVWRTVQGSRGEGSKVTLQLPGMSDHLSDLVLLGILGAGVIFLLWKALDEGKAETLDVAAFLLVLKDIISAVKERWVQRSMDNMGQNLANAPPAQPPAGPDGPIPPDEAIRAAVNDALRGGEPRDPPPARPDPEPAPYEGPDMAEMPAPPAEIPEEPSWQK